MVRKVEFWKRTGGKIPAKEFLDNVELKEKKNKFIKLLSSIQKLAEYGEEVLDGITFIKMKFRGCKKFPIIEIKEIPYRIYVLLTPDTLYLLEGQHKKRNNLEDKIKKIILQRAKNITLML